MKKHKIALMLFFGVLFLQGCGVSAKGIALTKGDIQEALVGGEEFVSGDISMGKNDEATSAYAVAWDRKRENCVIGGQEFQDCFDSISHIVEVFESDEQCHEKLNAMYDPSNIDKSLETQTARLNLGTMIMPEPDKHFIEYIKGPNGILGQNMIFCYNNVYVSIAWINFASSQDGKVVMNHAFDLYHLADIVMAKIQQKEGDK